MIWYRSSEGCPDGAAFLGRLRGAAAGAKLAGAGDRIDFVVTLGTTGSESSGRLERQTHSGTVGVREIAAPSCEEIADVLALTLTLTLDSAAPAAGEHAKSDEAPAKRPAGAQPEPGAAPHGTRERDADTPRSESAPPEPPASFSIGAQGGVLTHVVPALAPLGAAFVELEPNLPVLSRATLRLSLLGVLSERTSQPTLRMSLLAGRLEVCPLEVGSGALRARPCLGVDGGGVRAGSADITDDTGAWGALAAHARVAWTLGPSFALEAQLGGVAPLIRYALRTRERGNELYRSAPVGLSGAAGLAFRLP